MQTFLQLFLTTVIAICCTSYISSQNVITQYHFETIQFEKRLSTHDIAKAEKEGITFENYYGNETYLVAIPKHITVSENILPAFKPSKMAWQRRANEELVLQIPPPHAIDGDKVMLNIAFASVLLKANWEHIGKMNGFELLHRNDTDPYAIIKISPDLIPLLLEEPWVLYANYIPSPPNPDDIRGRNLHRVNRINGGFGANKEYTGAGILVNVRDDGRIFDHIDLRGRLEQSLSSDRGDHGEGVIGIFAGAGNLDPVNVGMAYGADIIATNYQSDFLDNTIALHRNRNLLITNSSYSDGCNDGYTNNSRIVDQQMWENPTLMHVFSAGNNGGENCGYGAGPDWGNVTGGHKIGKNVIAVANTTHQGFVVTSSSRGPVQDGRIKPDIAANGFDHMSLVERNDYEPFGGTSGAAPVVVGGAAILYEAHQKLFGSIPTAALIKAIMLNSANDAGNVGPDFTYGWGVFNAYRSLKTLEESRFESGIINEGERNSHNIIIPNNAKEAKIMVYWADRQGAQQPSKHLYTNLDIECPLTADSIVLPWVLDATPNFNTLGNPATRGKDVLNNMEQIVLYNPTPGTITVDVIGSEVPFGDAEYYIVWDFLLDEIDIIFPGGGEHILTQESNTVHWEATGDNGFFQIELLDADGEVIESMSSRGDRRVANLPNFNAYTPDVRLKISRDNVVGISQPFTIGSRVEDIEFIDSSGIKSISWDSLEGVSNFVIYLLGEKYMEPIDTTEDISYHFAPNIDLAQAGWVAVSPIFENGFEGLRSRARALIPRPDATIATDLPADEVRIWDFVEYRVTNPQPNTTYEWNFGRDASIEEETGPGPHDVYYDRRGSKLIRLTSTNDAGTTGTAFRLNVEREPEGNAMFITPVMDQVGTFSFETDLRFIDSLLWDFGDGTTSTLEQPTHTYQYKGTFEITVTGFDICGEFVIDQDLLVDQVVNVNEVVDRSSITITPNPNHGIFTISSSTPFNGIEIHDMSGRLIYESKLVSDNNTIMLDQPHPGIYMISLIGEGSRNFSRLVLF